MNKLRMDIPKTRFIKLILLLLCICNVTNNWAQAQWTNDVLYGKKARPMDLIVDHEGKIVVGGFLFENASSGSRISFLLSLDEETGDSINVVKCLRGFFCDNRDDIFDLDQGTDSEIFASGGSFNARSSYIAQIKSADDLSADWIHNNLRQEKIGLISDIVTTADRIVVASPYLSNRYAVAQFDYDGVLMWVWEIFVNSANSTSMKLAVSINGDIVVVYRVGLNPATHHIAKLNRQGEYLWSISTDKYPRGIAFINDVDFVTIEQDRASQRYQLVKYNNAGHSTILNENCNVEAPYEILSHWNGDIYVADHLYDLNTRLSSFGLLKMDLNGNEIWQHAFGSADMSEEPVAAKLSVNGSIVLLGRKKRGSDFGIVVTSVQVSTPFVVPTLTEWSTIILFLLLAILLVTSFGIKYKILIVS